MATDFSTIFENADSTIFENAGSTAGRRIGGGRYYLDGHESRAMMGPGMKKSEWEAGMGEKRWEANMKESW